MSAPAETSGPILSIRGLRKAYASGTEALKSVDLDIRRGEIFALLGPNGAGKTTLISIVCGIVTATAGEVLVDGLGWRTHYREARKRIGLVPQELTLDVFEPLISTVSFSRELFGRRPDPAGPGDGGREWDAPEIADPAQHGRSDAEPAGHGGEAGGPESGGDGGA